MEVYHVCTECKRVAKPIKDKSNHQWTYYSTDCAYCGGKKTVKIKFGKEELR